MNDLKNFVTAKVANAALGYRGRNGVQAKAKAGLIPGAFLLTPRLWMVPKKWVAEEALLLEREEGKKPGKPRGTIQKKKNSL